MNTYNGKESAADPILATRTQRNIAKLPYRPTTPSRCPSPPYSTHEKQIARSKPPHPSSRCRVHIPEASPPNDLPHPNTNTRPLPHPLPSPPSPSPRPPPLTLTHPSPLHSPPACTHTRTHAIETIRRRRRRGRGRGRGRRRRRC